MRQEQDLGTRLGQCKHNWVFSDDAILLGIFYEKAPPVPRPNKQLYSVQATSHSALGNSVSYNNFSFA